MIVEAITNIFTKLVPRLQRTIIHMALGGFLAAIAIHFLNRFNIVATPDRFTPDTFLSTLAVPLSILLVYELILLVKATTGSFILFIIAEFEVISLILLRDLFKRLDELQQSFATAVLIDIAIVAFGSIVLYFMIEILERISKHFVEGDLKEELPGKESKRMAHFKSLLEVGLLFFLSIVVIYEVIGYAIGITGAGLNTTFVQIIFSGLIVYSIIQLLLVLLINKTYETLFEHSAMVLASVIVLASLEAPTYIKVPLVIGSLLFVVSTLFLHSFARGKPIGAMFEVIDKKSKR